MPFFLCPHQREEAWLIWLTNLGTGAWQARWWYLQALSFSYLLRHAQRACKPVSSHGKTFGGSFASVAEACDSAEWGKFRKKAQVHCGLTTKTHSSIITTTTGDTGVPFPLVSHVDFSVLNSVETWMGIIFFLTLKPDRSIREKWTLAREWSDLIVLY